MVPLTVRPASQADEAFLRDMSALTGNWRPGLPPTSPEELAANPYHSRYIDGWARDGDAGVVADQDGRPVGAAWYRTFTVGEPGYGFLNQETPEISIAVEPDRRGQGVGTALLRALCRRARQDGIEALSLSVERDNPALHLYERLGFVEVEGTGDACTMRVDLSDR
jgi:ribosomal protein S18 acetylase RimI-like enzyme